jgi:hypothetical protein
MEITVIIARFNFALHNGVANIANLKHARNGGQRWR